MIAIDAGVDFVQGFYFSRPSTSLADIPHKVTDLDGLLQDYKSKNRVTRDPTRQLVSYFEDFFRGAADTLTQGTPVNEACSDLLNHPAVSRCYLVDANGVQTACLSNTSRGHWDSLLAYENVASLGSHHASHLLGLAKPAPEIYAEFERLVGARPEEIVFFDDLEANVESASARGWDAVRIDHEADTAKQMLDALRVRDLL